MRLLYVINSLERTLCIVTAGNQKLQLYPCDDILCPRWPVGCDKRIKGCVDTQKRTLFAKPRVSSVKKIVRNLVEACCCVKYEETTISNSYNIRDNERLFRTDHIRLQ